jgi:Tol biopolymer transport system component
MNADGSDQRQLTELRGDSYYRHPTWSPDGTKIAFLKAVNNSSRGVIVMNADGSDQRTLFRGDYHHPAWSPDGLKIAASRDGALVLINIDDSKVTQITPTPSGPATFSLDYEPAWSPDGSKIVFTRLLGCDYDFCSSSHLYVVNSDGSNPTDLTRQDNLGDRGYSFDGRNAWSPDGRKIIFGGGDLYVINPDGSGLTNLTNTNDRSEDSPSWQSLPQAAVPARINSVAVSGKKLFVFGENFDPGAVILLNGEEQKTRNDSQNPQTALIGKKVGKKLNRGDKLQVRNPNGTVSQEFVFAGSITQ